MGSDYSHSALFLCNQCLCSSLSVCCCLFHDVDFCCSRPCSMSSCYCAAGALSWYELTQHFPGNWGTGRQLRHKQIGRYFYAFIFLLKSSSKGLEDEENTKIDDMAGFLCSMVFCLYVGFCSLFCFRQFLDRYLKSPDSGSLNDSLSRYTVSVESHDPACQSRCTFSALVLHEGTIVFFATEILKNGPRKSEPKPDPRGQLKRSSRTGTSNSSFSCWLCCCPGSSPWQATTTPEKRQSWGHHRHLWAQIHLWAQAHRCTCRSVARKGVHYRWRCCKSSEALSPSWS